MRRLCSPGSASQVDPASASSSPPVEEAFLSRSGRRYDRYRAATPLLPGGRRERRNAR